MLLRSAGELVEPSPEDEEEPADVLGLAPSSSTGLGCTIGAGEAA